MNTQTLYEIYLLDLSGVKISKAIAKQKNFKLSTLKQLVNKEYLQVIGDEFEISDVGREYVNSIIDHPEYISSSTRAWNLEVCTGIRPDGKRTKRENIVIPKSQYVEPSYELNEEDIDVVLMVKKIAKNTNNSELDVCYAISEGLVKLCKTCGNYSIFQKNASRSSGVQTQCAKCRKSFVKNKISANYN